MSKLARLLKVALSPDKNVAVIDTIEPGDSILFIGTSLTNVGIRPREKTEAFTFAKADGEPTGIIALEVRRRGNAFGSGIIRVNWREERPVELDRNWIPDIQRIGQVANSEIEVVIGDKHYVSLQRDPDEMLRMHGYRAFVVPDANLLCRYLYGTATANEVEAAARRYSEERSTDEMLAEARAGMLNLSGQIDELRREKGEALRQVELLRDEQAHAAAIAAHNKEFLKKLDERVRGSRWGLKKAITRMLSERLQGAFRIHRQFRKEGE